MNAITYYTELMSWLLSHVTDTDMFLVHSIVTCSALFWSVAILNLCTHLRCTPHLLTPHRLLHRAWLTLWKPVPELITILGVEVPEPPEVSLAGIKADNVTLHWTRPESNKVVHKYLIQVNGVNGNGARVRLPPWRC